MKSRRRERVDHKMQLVPQIESDVDDLSGQMDK